MGLDISMRYRRIDAKPDHYEAWCGKQVPVYDKVDLHSESESFQGRSEFDTVRRWVGDERLYCLVLKAPIYAEYGWYMELERD